MGNCFPSSSTTAEPVCLKQMVLRKTNNTLVIRNDKPMQLLFPDGPFGCYGDRLVGEYVETLPFNMGGFDWSVRIYLRGKDESCRGFVSVFLRLKRLYNYDTQRDVKSVSCADIEVSILAKDGFAHITQCGNPIDFTEKDPSWGWLRFTDRAHLLASAAEYLEKDRLMLGIKFNVKSYVPSESNTS